MALDTNVVVAALLGWHDHHEEARLAVEAALRDDDVLLPVPVVVEAYAVMTRLPAPHRVTAEAARELLHESFSRQARVVGVPARSVWRFLTWAVDSGVSGGRTYDAQIVACAVAAGATHLVTFNVRHFRGLDDRIEIVDPLGSDSPDSQR